MSCVYLIFLVRFSVYVAEVLLMKIFIHLLFVIILQIFIFNVLASEKSVFPDNVKLSYDMELLRNPAINDEDYKYLAKCLLTKIYGLKEQEAGKKIATMNTQDLKRYIIRDFPVEYYEIPIKELDKLGKISYSMASANMQIIEKDNEKYMRWFISPLHDNQYIRNNFAKFRGRDGNFVGKLTSSRSMIIKDQVANNFFSIKTSVERSHGPFTDKKYLADNAEYHYNACEILSKDEMLKNSLVADKSFVAIHGSAFNEGQLVRPLEILQDGNHLFSLASLIDESWGPRLAKANGHGNDSFKFLKNEIMEKLGKISGRLYSKFGASHGSFHSQNIAILVDKNMKLIDVKIRDPDLLIDYNSFKSEVLKGYAQTIFEYSAVKSKDMIVDLSIFNGYKKRERYNHYNLYSEAAPKYFQSFLKQVAEDRNLNIPEEYLEKAAYEYTMQILNDSKNGKPLKAVYKKSAIDRILNQEVVIGKNQLNVIPLKNDEINDVLMKYFSKNAVQTSELNSLFASDRKILENSWNKLVEDFIKDPKNSHLGQFLDPYDWRVVSKIARLFDNNDFINREKFLETVLLKRKDFWQYCDPFATLFSTKKLNQNFMNIFLSGAGQNVINFTHGQLAERIKLYDYPQQTINKLYMRLSEANLQKDFDDLSSKYISQQMQNNKEKIRQAIDTRLRIKDANNCFLLALQQLLQNK